MKRPSDAAISALLRLAVIGVLGVGMLLVFRFTNIGETLRPEALRSTLDSFGPLRVPAFIVIYGVLIAISVPGTIVTLLGAAIFGPVGSIPVNYCGAVLGAFIGYHIANQIGGDAMDTLFRGRVKLYDRYRDLMRRRGFESALYLRLMPTPYSLVSYLGGLSPISAGRFTLATAIGIIPGSIAISFFLGTVIEQVEAGDPSAILSWELLAAVSLFATAALIPRLLRTAQRKWGWFPSLSLDGGSIEDDQEVVGELKPVDGPADA